MSGRQLTVDEKKLVEEAREYKLPAWELLVARQSTRSSPSQLFKTRGCRPANNINSYLWNRYIFYEIVTFFAIELVSTNRKTI